MNPFTPILTIGFILLFFLFNWIKVLKEYERGVIFRLGRALPLPKGPGLILVLWPIDTLKKVSLRTIVMDVPPQDIITKDNVSVKVNAVVYYRVLDPKKAILEVQDFQYATSQLSQTTLRSVLGEVELDELLSARDKLNLKLQTIIDQHSDPWGVKVSMVEIKHVDLPQDMQRAMAKQAEAERERRAKVIHAEGEFEASVKLLMAAEKMSQNATTIHLRYLQTLMDISADNSSTIVFPLPIDLLQAFVKNTERNTGDT
jgi:regulator of protease activity HflC (stomatin/prohibitin superfamily)